MSEPTERPGAGDTSAPPPSPQRRQIVVVAIVGMAVILMVSLGLFIFLGLRSLLRQEGAAPTPSPPVTALTATVPASPLASPSCETIISSGDVEVAVPLPVSLTVGNQSFPVTPIVPAEQGWRYPADQSGKAVWACGTVVNYVLALEPTPENRTLVDNLRPGDKINLKLSNNVGLSFRFADRQETPAGEQSVLDQRRPRLTLIIEQESGNWQVATADYATEEEEVQAPGGELAQVGQPVAVGDARVTVLKGHANPGGADVGEGSMYYLVEFSVENTGEAPLVADAFATQLKDSLGNVYLVSPAASAAGENGPLSGDIAPGTTAQGTAGYLVPDPLSGPLTWTFKPHPTRDPQVTVQLPYETDEGSVAQVGALDVTLTDAFLDEAGEVLIIEGEARNVGEAPVTVKVEDINLTSSAGVSALVSAAPPLPWTIQPGQTQVIELQYERPNASTALLELRGFSFEVGGL